MTPADWAASADPLAMYRHLRGRPGTAPLRWFGRVLGLNLPQPDRKLLQLVRAAADLAPAAADPAGWDVWAVVRDNLDGSERALGTLSALLFALGRADTGLLAGAVYDRMLLVLLADARDNRPLADALRCLFGDPFDPVGDPRAWRSATAIHIAEAAADDFARLPVLADALEDAGCEHPGLLAHLRGRGPHRPGCFALEAVLGAAEASGGR